MIEESSVKSPYLKLIHKRNFEKEESLHGTIENSPKNISNDKQRN